ncbi:MAG: disulfide bond formation protein B [Acetobacter aceti]|uniref:Dihydrolipoamide acyltransferase n=1 Tax=Acetobacter aceti TaxID=435 RepID=A0A1U9KIA9_ACEAC|nr:disulfide bond formation protein B [Acetobacter aceti]AQS85552.1 dihydrolipoamide acyltransferase [Acetobacter aceti]
MVLMPRRRIFNKQTPGTVRLPSLLLVLTGVAALLFVWWVQEGLGIAPCALCLWERWPWRFLVVIGAVGLLAPRRWARTAAWLGVPMLLVDLALVVVHAGVEWQFWKSPLPECLSPHLTGATMAERLASMPLRPAKPCDMPTYIFNGLPISLTVMEGVAALIVLVLLVTCLLRPFGGRTRS